MSESAQKVHVGIPRSLVKAARRPKGPPLASRMAPAPPQSRFASCALSHWTEELTRRGWQAMRQAAFRAEYQQQRAELTARLGETNRARNVIIAILATL